jgi:hypothetical protein
MNSELYLHIKTIRSQLPLIYVLPVNMILGTLVLPGIGSMISGYYKKKILSFRVLESPHTANVIFKSIIEVLQEYNLKRDMDNKVFSISFVNASNIIASIDIFKRSLNPIMNGAMFHQKCVCHILNLVVKAGLKTEAVKLLIIKFKDALNHIVSN